MMSLFKSRPAPVQHVQISGEDRLIAAYSGFTPEEWVELPALVQADKREGVVWAQGFQP